MNVRKYNCTHFGCALIDDNGFKPKEKCGGGATDGLECYGEFQAGGGGGERSKRERAELLKSSS